MNGIPVAEVKVLHAVAAVTADSLSSALDLSDYEGHVAVIVSYTASGDAGKTVAMAIHNADTSGGSYTAVTGGGFTTTANTAGTQTIYINTDEIKKFIKLNFDVTTGDTISVTVSAIVVGKKKYA